MITSAIFIALLGTINLKPAISAAISSEPIQITVNENFNAPPGQVSREFQSLEPGVVHQGANFYFKPKFTLPSSSVPHHIEALISLIRQHHSCAQDATKEIFENKLMEILKPFMYAKETVTDIVEEENSSKTANPSSILITEEPKPATPELLVIPEAPALPSLSFNDIVEEELKKDEMETKSVPEELILIEIEPKPAAPELLVIPEAPVLLPFSADEMRIVEEVKKEELKTVPESIVVDIESKPTTPKLLVIPEASVLPPISFNEISAFVEEKMKEKGESTVWEESIVSSQKPTIIEIEPKPATPELLVIPKAPMLPPLSFNDISAFVEEEVKKEESLILEETKGVSEEPVIAAVALEPAAPGLLVIPEAPVLPPLSYNDVSAIVEEGIKKEESVILEKAQGVPEEPIVIEVEPKHVTPEHLVIPEAPVLPPLSYADVSEFVEEGIKKEESVILEKAQGVPEEPIVIEVEPKHVTPEHLVIPEAPVLPPLSYADVSEFVEEGIKKEESVILEKAKGVSEEPIVVEVGPKPVAPEHLIIPEAPVLPPLSYNDVSAFVEEGIKKEESVILEKAQGVPEEPIVIKVERKHVTPEHLVIPEAPVLPPLSYADVSEFVEEGIKKEESVILEKAQGVPEKPTVIEVEPKHVTPEHLVIPEAPVLPPLSYADVSEFVEEVIKKEESVILEKAQGVSEEPIVVEVGPKPVAPELPPLSYADVSEFVEEGIKKEESAILEKAKSVSEEPIIVEVGPKPVTVKHLVIPEAPVLPRLSYTDVSEFVEEGIKKEESAILEKAKRVPEEPIVITVEPKHVTPEHLVIPEAPVLPPLSYADVSEFVEEGIKKEESVILEKAQGVPEEPIVIEVEPKHVTSEHLVIPEAPVLLPLSYADVSEFVEEGIKKEESAILEKAIGVSEEPIVVEVGPKPVTPEHLVIPEAPVLPPLSYADVSEFVEKGLKKEESAILEKAKRVSEEPIVIEVEPKPAAPELVFIPEAPVLPPSSADEMRIVEEMKKEELKTVPESIVVDIESKSTTPELLIIPEAPVLLPLSYGDISTFVEEEIKAKGESTIWEEFIVSSQEPTIIEIEPKPATPELLVIPEAPVLPPLSLNNISAFVEEEIKKEESIKLEETKDVSEEPIVIEVGPKPVTVKHLVIPEAPVIPPLSYTDVSEFVEEGIKKEESAILEKAKGVSEEPIVIEVEPKPVTPEHLVIPEAPVLPPLPVNGIRIVEEVKIEEPKTVPESIVVDIESKPATPELLVIPEAPVLPPLSFDDISEFVEEEIKKEESVILEKAKGVSEEPIVIEVQPKHVTPEHLVIPEAPVLPPLSFKAFSSIVEDEVKKEKSVLLKESTRVFPSISDPETVIVNVEPKPAIQELVMIPEAPVSPPMSDITTIEEVKSEESIKSEEFTGTIPETSARPTSFVETETAESYALEDNIFPVAAEELKIEIPILLEESIEVFPPAVSSIPTLQENGMSNSYVLEKDSQPNSEGFVKKTFPPTIIRPSKPSNNLGLFSYAPFLSHLSNHASKTKQVMFPKPSSLERFLLKKHPLRLPVAPFPKLPLNDIKSPLLENTNQFLYPIAYAHDVVEKRIAPNMAFKKNTPPKRVKIFIHSNIPKGSS